MKSSIGLQIARLLWTALALAHWVLWLSSLPVFLARAAAGTIPTVAPPGNPVQISNALVIAWAGAWGLSPGNWAWLNTAIAGLSILIFTLVGALVSWRVRSWFGWFTAVIMLAGFYPTGTAIYAAHPQDVYAQLFQLGGLLWPFFFLWLYLFPDGKPVPQRLRWLLLPALAVFMALFVVLLYAGHLPLPEALVQRLASFAPLGAVLVVILFVTVLGGQTYRYLRISGPLERLQTRWFLYGLALVVLPSFFIERLVSLPNEASTLLFTVLPISIGISILRYRLWDIDVVIRRTVAYGAITSVLALVYFGSVLLLQRLFIALTGQASAAAVVLSTLAIAALFNPLRRRMQEVIDRAFYRSKYDAQRMLAAFAATTSEASSIEQVNDGLVAVLQGTLQPGLVTLWMPQAGTVTERGAAGRVSGQTGATR